jgi:hypothetical protein
MRSPIASLASSVVGDERASRIVDVDHGACVALERGGNRVYHGRMDLPPLPDGVRHVDD